MIINNEYKIEADEHNWVLVKSHISSVKSEKTGNYETIEKKTYYGTLQQVVHKLVSNEVKSLEDLISIVGSERLIADLILKKISTDLSTGPYRLVKHGEQL